MSELSGKNLFEMGIGQAKSWSPSWLLLLLVPALPAIFKYFGVTDENGLYDKLPQGVRDFLETIGNFLNDMFKSLKGFARDLLNKEETTALQDLQARIDTKFTALGEIDKKLGLTGVADKIRGMMKASSEDFFSISVSLDSKAALENTRELHGKISHLVLAELKAAHPKHTPEDVKRFTAAAREAASYATGLTDKVGNNPNLLQSGYGAQLLAFQQAIKAPSEYQTGQAATSTVDQSLIELAKGIISKEVTLNDSDNAPPRPAATQVAGVGR